MNWNNKDWHAMASILEYLRAQIYEQNDKTRTKAFRHPLFHQCGIYTILVHLQCRNAFDLNVRVFRQGLDGDTSK